MKNYLFSIITVLSGCIISSCSQSTPSWFMSFDSGERIVEYHWAVRDLAPDVPADWSEYNYLVLEMKASSPQRFMVGPVTAAGTWTKSVQPFPGAWIRFCIPLDYYREIPPSAVDMAATYNKPRQLGQVNIHHPGVGALTGIDSLYFCMRFPINNPQLEIRAVSLAKDDPGDKLLEDIYLVDQFGQWNVQDWPDKIHNEEELQIAWNKEDKELKPLFENVSQYGGYKEHQVKATGYFRTEQIDGKWWFVDPEGYFFLSVGVDCVNASVRTSVKDRESIFEDLIMDGNHTDYYFKNIQKRYGENASTAWMHKTIERMHAWGLNTIANWSSREIININQCPFVLSLPGLQLEKGIMGLPDIYDPAYLESIDKSIGEMASTYKDNPWLLGYFVGNEQPWPNHESVLCDRILVGEDTPMKKALQAHLASMGDTPESREEFVLNTFSLFLELVNKTLKKHDPNHLNLGMRFGESSDKVIAAAGKHFDVFSINCYEIQPNRHLIEQVERLTGLPIIIGEYHFGVPDRGMAAGIVQVANHEERGHAYRYYNEQGYAHPSLIGAHWFQWIDQPNTGRMDGENYNIGLLDITDRPYPELVKAMKETHIRLYNIHAGKISPYDKQPKNTTY